MPGVSSTVLSRLRALETTAPYQSVTLLGSAQQQPLQGGVGSWQLPVHFTASCIVCEWYLLEIKAPGDANGTLGFGSSDLLAVNGWVMYHLDAVHVHKRAWEYFVAHKSEYF